LRVITFTGRPAARSCRSPALLAGVASAAAAATTLNALTGVIVFFLCDQGM
jgi:hypothetical protein